MSAINTFLDELGKRLQSISTSNGDAVTIQKVTRAKLTPLQDGDLPAANYWISGDSIELRDYSGEKHAASVLIELYDKTRDRPFTDVAVSLYEAAVAAIGRDAAGVDSPSLGFIVESLHVDSMQAIIGEGQAPWCGAIIELTIRYRTALGKTTLL